MGEEWGVCLWIDEGAREVGAEKREKGEGQGISCSGGGESMGEGSEEVKRVELCESTGVKASCREGSG